VAQGQPNGCLFCFQRSSDRSKWEDSHNMTRWLPALALIALLLSAGTLACGGASPVTSLTGVAVSQRLTLQVHSAELAERLVYQEDGQTYTIAAAPGRRIVAMEATVTNPGAEAALLVIGADSATLSAGQNDSYALLDPRLHREATPAATAPKYYSPWLWGPFTLKLGFGVRGWLFFDVPETVKLEDLTSLSWRSLDSMSVPLAPQRR